MLPQRLATVAEAQQPRIEAGEVLGDVAQISTENVGGLPVGGGVDDLGKVDHRQPVVGDEDVEGGQVPMHPTALQQQSHLTVDLAMEQLRHLWRQIAIRQTGRGSPVFVHEKLHQQTVFVQ